MTEPQIKRLKDELNEKYYGDRPRLQSYLKMPITKEDNITFVKLGICDMMLSCLAYGNDYFDMIQEPWYVRNLGREGYDWEKLKAAGVRNAKQTVAKLWEEMKYDFAMHATVKRDVYTDSEGLSYNSIVWDD